MDNIAKAIDKDKFIKTGNKGYGMRYEQIVNIEGANGKRANVLTAWIDDNGKKRLISVYVDKGEK